MRTWFGAIIRSTSSKLAAPAPADEVVCILNACWSPGVEYGCGLLLPEWREMPEGKRDKMLRKPRTMPRESAELMIRPYTSTRLAPMKPSPHSSMDQYMELVMRYSKLRLGS